MNDDYLDYTYEDPYAVQPERLRPGRINLPPKVPPKVPPKMSPKGSPKMVVPQNKIVKQQGTFNIHSMLKNMDS
jgi:hypothetical protein